MEFREALEAVNRPGTDKKADVPKQAAVFTGRPQAPSQGATKAKARRNVPILIVAVVIILLMGGSGLYASLYGYRALLSKVLPASQEEKHVETAQGSAEVAATADSPAADAAAPNAAGSDVDSPSHSRKGAGIPFEASAKRDTEEAHDTNMPESMPAETGRISAEQPPPSKRAAMPTVLVVTSGDPNIADIIESVIGKKLLARSLPLAASGEIQALSDRYGQHGIPLNALDPRRLKADVLSKL